MPKDGSKVLRAQIKAGEKDMLRLVKESRRNVERKIGEAIKKKSFVTASSTRDGLYNSIVKEYAVLNSRINNQIKTQGRRVAKEWVDIAGDDLKATGAKVATFGKFSEKYLDDIVAKVNPAVADKIILVNPRIASMAKSDIDAIRVIVTDTMRKGAIEGLTTPEMAVAMKERIKDFNPSMVIKDKAGRVMNTDSYFAMLNRTVSANVSRETYTTMALDAGYDLQQIDGGITDGSLQPGDPCSRWAGKIISMTGTTKGYPTYADALADGMFHPNCVHTLSVVTPSSLPEAKVEQKEVAKEGREGRKEVNAERKKEGLKPAKFGTASVSGKGMKRGADKIAGASKFVPAKTVKEAEEFANKNLNVKKYDVRVGNGSIDAVNNTNAGLLRLQNAGEDLSDVSVIIENRGGGRAGEYNFARQEININPRVRGRTEKQIDYLNRTQSEVGFSSSGDKNYVLIHEFGHHKNKINVADKPGGYFKVNLSKLSKSETETALKVSKYASKEPAEFVAETFLGLSTGKKYSPDVMALYKKYGGGAPVKL